MMMPTTTPAHSLQPWQATAASFNPSVVKLSSQSATFFGLFGKEAEFTQLLKHVEQGQSKLCLVLGDAGIGKSTLLTAVGGAIAQQSAAQGLPAKYQVLMIDFLAYEVPQLASGSLFFFVLNSLIQWADALEERCFALLNSKTPEGFTLLWNRETLAALITKANEQPSVAQRRVFLEVHIQSTLRAQQNWIDKLFLPIKETIQVLVEVLDSPWISLLVDFRQKRLPSLVALAEKRQTSEDATQLFERDVLATLISITNFFKQHLSSAANGEATLTLIIDNWDGLLSFVSAEKLALYKAELMALTVAFTEKKQHPFHLILATRTNDLGRSLGQELYAGFRNKVLISPFHPLVERQFVEQTQLLPTVLQVASVYDWLKLHAQGNPYWIELLCTALKWKTHKALAETLEVPQQTLAGWLAGLAVEHATDGHAFLLTQLQLGVLQYGVAYGEALQQTISLLTYQPFEVPIFLEKMTTFAPQVAVNDVAMVLRKLFLLGCLKTVVSTAKREGQPPRYKVTHRLLLSYLKTSLTQTKLSQQFNFMEQQETNWFEAKQQLQTLKTILPLTLEQGELSVEKVQGLLQLTQQFQPEVKEDFYTFFVALLEETLASETVSIQLKIDALAGLAQLNQEQFLPALLQALGSEDERFRQTALSALIVQGSLQGGNFASAQRASVLQQLLARFTMLPLSESSALQPLLLLAIEAWAFPLKQETKLLLVNFLQGVLGKATVVPAALPLPFILLANRLLADPQLSEEEKEAFLPEVLTLVQGILENESISGAEALRLVKHYSVENTPEPLFALLEKLAMDSPANTQPFAVKQEALLLLLVRLAGRENALQAWLNQLDVDLTRVVERGLLDVTLDEADVGVVPLSTDFLLNKRIGLASLQANWPDWAKQQLEQLVKTQLNSRAWEAWLGQPDLLWVLLKCLLMVSPSVETTALVKQWADRLQTPALEEFEGLQLLGACLRGQLTKVG